ncbi:protein disulfide isomerase pTAC5, chloroplastic [Tripterygium wilfordii]|uniref:protein disulfide isomerase pTAC5, chloroplastic n=1 Tax=Tripterygium wilfordii TaxID=458696 RepID=UPI0018F85B6F|nr:protein disulfide isomerase pTAC5, chloroplastic [Tripterygium wilfordii]
MTSTSLFPCIHLPRHSTFHPRPDSYLSKPSFHFKSLVCFSSSTNASNSDREEISWLREEQRWSREEQRWLREEQRWLRERELLLREISALKLQIQALGSSVKDSSVSETIANMAGLLQVLKEKNLIADSASSFRPIDLGDKREIEEQEKKVVVEEDVRVSEKEEWEKERQALRMGSEGEEVRAMQEALLKLGFYSGEEDMEYSSFSSGTERAVKTWQATLGAREDGIMTAELLKRLYMAHQMESAGTNVHLSEKGRTLTVPQNEGANGAVVASVTEISEIQQKVVKESVTEVEVSQHRVFLLGENRWEEPSRLTGDKQVGGSKTNDTSTKCYACRGVGHLMCTECDGSGEPNIEPQFYEWVNEEAKCPYCEGTGHTVCDVCGGKKVV